MAQAEEKKGNNPATDAAAPSMEEILQSIRGVISGDEATAQEDVLELTEMAEDHPAAPTPDPIAPVVKDAPQAPEKSILDEIDAALEPAALPAAEPIVSEPIAATPPDPIITMPEPSPVAEQPKAVADMAEPITEIPELAEDEPDNTEIASKSSHQTRLLGEKAAKQSSGSLKELVSSLHDKQVDSPYSRGGTSLEDLVIEAMKPFLAEWLNKNLPIIVKKIVEKEVKRLVPREEDD